MIPWRPLTVNWDLSSSINASAPIFQYAEVCRLWSPSLADHQIFCDAPLLCRDSLTIFNCSASLLSRNRPSISLRGNVFWFEFRRCTPTGVADFSASFQFIPDSRFSTLCSRNCKALYGKGTVWQDVRRQMDSKDKARNHGRVSARRRTFLS